MLWRGFKRFPHFLVTFLKNYISSPFVTKQVKTLRLNRIDSDGNFY